MYLIKFSHFLERTTRAVGKILSRAEYFPIVDTSHCQQWTNVFLGFIFLFSQIKKTRSKFQPSFDRSHASNFVGRYDLYCIYYFRFSFSSAVVNGLKRRIESNSNTAHIYGEYLNCNCRKFFQFFLKRFRLTEIKNLFEIIIVNDDSLFYALRK